MPFSSLAIGHTLFVQIAPMASVALTKQLQSAVRMRLAVRFCSRLRAARSIEAVARGMLQRKMLMRQLAAALVVQSLWRSCARKVQTAAANYTPPRVPHLRMFMSIVSVIESH